MPHLFDEAQIDNALRTEAIPLLERLAENSRLRDRTLNRFDRDEPPPYESSTDDEEIAMFHPALRHCDDNILDEFKDLMDAPLNSDEQSEVAWRLDKVAHVYDPATRYRAEELIEQERVGLSWRPADGLKEYFHLSGRPSSERMNIVIRHNIKRRWQRLGVWNPQWGIPGRLSNPQPNDDLSRWKWRWQHGSSAAEWTPEPDVTASNPEHPIRRAVRLRQDLQRGEHSTVPPHSRLQDDDSASQAESFITSRPWFTYNAELYEERIRFNRIPYETRRDYEYTMAKHINEQWKLKGDWREDWMIPGEGVFAGGWKWRHESPTPEPEDMTLFNTTSMEFTPSEADALEAVRPPTPPPKIRYFPPGDPRLGPRTGVFALGAPQVQPSKSTDKLAATGPKQPPLPRQRRHPRRDENPAQPLRRSARIAAKKANLPPSQERRPVARPLPTQSPTGVGKKGRPRNSNGSAVSKAPARPIPTQQPTGVVKRGRPSKSSGSTVFKAPARPRRGAPTAGKLSRGRPRKGTARK